MCACPSAKAGTHTPYSLILGAVAETFSLIERRWLWVPAFSGTTREDSIVKQSNRHCEPTGRANARPFRHCERSEAIHGRSEESMDCFVASAPRNDAAIVSHTTSPSRRDAPESIHLFPPKEGVGNAGCPLHPQPRVHLVVVERTRVTTSTPESPDVPARNGLTAYNALSPEYRAFLPPSPSGYGTSAPGRADMPPKDLTPTTEASGPHDFAVRCNIARQLAV